MPDTHVTQVDIAIVGGGLVGASLACALAPLIERAGIRVAVIEPSSLALEGRAAYQPSFDERSSAIAYGSRRHFEHMGLWERLSAHAEPIRHIHVSQRGRLGVTRLSAQEAGLDALGYVIPNAWMGQVMLSRLAELPIDWRCLASVASMQPTKNGYRLTLEDGQCLETGLTVLADGGRSPLKAQLGIEDESFEYHDHAVIANVTLSQPHHNVAYERFDSVGPMALLPLSGNDMALVWTMPAAAADGVMAMGDMDFLAALQQRFGERVGYFCHVGARHRYPLSKRHAREQIRPHLAILGNAAHALHPVAGQGFNLALRGVMDLSRTLSSSIDAGLPIGNIASLECFEQQRQRDRQRIAEGSHWLVTLFGIDNTALAHVRGAGLGALNLVGPLRRTFMRYAMGIER